MAQSTLLVWDHNESTSLEVMHGESASAEAWTSPLQNLQTYKVLPRGVSWLQT